MFRDYSHLPDFLSEEKLQYYFNEFLTTYSDNEDKIESLNNLNELTNRQCDTYRNLDVKIRDKIEAFLIEKLDLESYEIMDIVLSIIPNLGLKEVYNYIILKKNLIKNRQVISLIEDAIIDYGDTVADPYSGLAQFNPK